MPSTDEAALQPSCGQAAVRLYLRSSRPAWSAPLLERHDRSAEDRRSAAEGRGCAGVGLTRTFAGGVRGPSRHRVSSCATVQPVRSRFVVPQCEERSKAYGDPQRFRATVERLLATLNLRPGR